MNDQKQGFTLIEFTISLSIGLYLLTFASLMYVSLHKTMCFIQGLSEIQENGRVAWAWLTREVRMAGFIGCPHPADVTVVGNHSFKPSQSLVGWSNAAPVPFPIPRAVNNSDVLLIQYADPTRTPILTAQAKRVRFSRKATFSPQAVLLLSDCQHAETLQLENFHLHYAYGKDATMGPLRQIIYYVADTQRKNQANQPIYALYRRDLNASVHHPIELAEGVEKMEICYGIPLNSRTLEYVTADTVTRWEKVRNLSITLYLTSTNNAGLSRPLTVPQEDKRLLDRRLKRTWQHTIALRARESRHPCPLV